MFKSFGMALFVFALLDTAGAAEKTRFGFPDLAAQFLPLPPAENWDFLKERAL
jgi:hypothetical protein